MPAAQPKKPAASLAAAAARAPLLLLLLFAATLLLLLATTPATAHDWIGANGTPDCECLPHFKLDCSSTAHVEKAWKTLVSRKCNATVATAGKGAPQAEAKIELLAAAGNTSAGSAPAKHGGAHGSKAPAAAKGQEAQEDPAATPARVYRCQVDQDCYEAYHVVAGHHYGCPPSFLPLAVAEGMHWFQTPSSPVEEDGSAAPDTVCQGCFQPRYLAPAARRPPPCPKLSCHHNEEALLGNLTLAAERGCKSDCSSDGCRDAYQFLRVHHDGCVLNDNPFPARLAADRLREACAAHECAFSNGTYAAGNYTVDCARDKNAGPFRAPLAALLLGGGEEGAQHIEVDHSAHDHGAASSAPSNLPPASSAAVGCRVAGGAIAATAAALLLMMMMVA